jgi:hypothetical protein
MIATFYNGDETSIAYVLGDNMTLQDAYNATINNHFAPTKISLMNPNNHFAEGGNMAETAPDLQKSNQIGKHSAEEIMEKHNVSVDKLSKLFHEGMLHELEHTDSYVTALAIAKDHIYERLDYYQRLKEMKLSQGGMLSFMEKGGKLPKLPSEEKMFHLPLEMAVYVPSTSDVSKEISSKELNERVDIVKKRLAEMFGGYTSAGAIGGYVAQDGKLVNEKVVRVVAYGTEESFQKNKKQLVEQISKWAEQWGQEAIGFEYEGDLYYIDAKYERGGVTSIFTQQLTLEDI